MKLGTGQKMYHCDYCCREGCVGENDSAIKRPDLGPKGDADYEEMTPILCDVCYKATKEGRL